MIKFKNYLLNKNGKIDNYKFKYSKNEYKDYFNYNVPIDEYRSNTQARLFLFEQ
jgi:hypothetical protein